MPSRSRGGFYLPPLEMYVALNDSTPLSRLLDDMALKLEFCSLLFRLRAEFFSGPTCETPQ